MAMKAEGAGDALRIGAALQGSRSAEASEAEFLLVRRMAIVGQLTGGVVHDFNNILTVIAGTIEILAEAVAGQPELEAVAGLIGEAAARGASLTSHLLAFARGKPSQPCDVDVNALLVDAARLLQPTLGEQIEINTTLAAGLSPALVDPSRLMAAILNLAIMARDAMPQGGTLTLETSHAASGEGGIGAKGEVPAADHVVVAVNAFGYGACGEQPDRAFIDLNLVHDLIGQSNGDIKIRSEAGRGTSIKIYLPRARHSVQARAEEYEAGNGTILIVEDDTLVRNYVVTQLRGLDTARFPPPMPVKLWRFSIPAQASICCSPTSSCLVPSTAGGWPSKQGIAGRRSGYCIRRVVRKTGGSRTGF
jgi:hypothetical protein